MKNPTNSRALATVGILVFACAAAFILFSKQSTSKNEQTVTIGVITPLTGETATHGIRVKHGIELAIEEINAAGGIQGKKVVALYEDSACDSSQAISAAYRLLAQNVAFFLGPQCSGAAMATAPLLQERKSIMISSIASVPDLSLAGDYIFRNSETGAAHGDQMAQFAYNTLQSKKAAILHINLDNGLAYKNSFTETFEKLGGAIVSEQAYDQGTTDFRAQITKIKSSSPDVIYIAGQAAEHAIKQIRELGIDVPITSMNGIEVPELFEIVGSQTENIFFTSSAFNSEDDNERISSFVKKYNSRYEEKAEAFSANSYDAMMILAKSIASCVPEVDTTCVKEKLYEIEYDGVGGKTTFDEYGDVHKKLIVKTVKNGAFTPFFE